MSDHRTYPAAERVVTAWTPGGMALRVYENSRTMFTEAVLTQGEAFAVAQRLSNWTPPDEPETQAMPEYWPPTPGEQWRDARQDLWIVLGDGSLLCLSDDPRALEELGPKPLAADEVHRTYGPINLAMAALDADCPF